MAKDKKVEESWEFWKPIVCFKNGKINLPQLKKELADYHTAMQEVPKVYMHVTGGLLSKINYESGVVIAAADDHCTKTHDRELLAQATSKIGCRCVITKPEAGCPAHQ